VFPQRVLPLILRGVGVQLAFPTITLLLPDRFHNIASVQAFASLRLSCVGADHRRISFVEPASRHLAARPGGSID
jgi:hypothetical protein